MKNFGLTPLGAGVGLRHEHFEEILAGNPPCRWFEIISDNFLDFGGYARETLKEIRSRYPVIPHGVCLSIGSTDPLDRDYLQRLKAFIREIDAPWTSDHLCFTVVDHTNLNDLIPVPFTEECVKNIVDRMNVVQDILECPVLLENVTRYVTVSDREMSESEFISSVLEGANCGLLLDVTNVYLNSQFHKFDPFEFICSLPHQRIGQIHLAGWEAVGDRVIDSHDAPVPAEVWDLYKKTIELIGNTSVLVEWDAQLPPFARLLEEADIAQSVLDSTQQLKLAV